MPVLHFLRRHKLHLERPVIPVIFYKLPINHSFAAWLFLSITSRSLLPRSQQSCCGVNGENSQNMSLQWTHTVKLNWTSYRTSFKVHTRSLFLSCCQQNTSAVRPIIGLFFISICLNVSRNTFSLTKFAADLSSGCSVSGLLSFCHSRSPHCAVCCRSECCSGVQVLETE